MSYWKASAAARQIPPDETPRALVSALETIQYVADALACKPTEESILDAIEALKQDLEDSQKETESVEEALGEARKRLETIQQENEQAALQSMMDQRDAAQDALNAAYRKLLHYEPAVEAARKLVAAADGQAKPKRGKR